MRKSKLELYEEILEVLVSKPSTVDYIAYELKTDCTVLRRRLDFLIKNGLVEERNVNEKILYAITERGTAVLRGLNFSKYLRRIAKKIRVIDEAFEVIRELEKKT